MTLQINGKSFTALVDSGADITIISSKFWPKSWPLSPVSSVFTSAGKATDIQQSIEIFLCKGPEGQAATIQPYVTDIAINLWERDLLSQWGAYTNFPYVSPAATNTMSKMNYNPLKGLGQENGHMEPITAEMRPPYKGLGYPVQN
ncbi:endogenous retrovirus group K member 10 Pro protein-like [Puma concolor]|uniref:Endogenous retrovirus group K member 10 Pro protein-like n=1 Tax=Puma concolor TaxID=9696 RepID=A0A6P6HID6_PUMCO|nr:endogenous retrovirus group K member 10 Pro protein-like [Puma concolor]